MTRVDIGRRNEDVLIGHAEMGTTADWHENNFNLCRHDRGRTANCNAHGGCPWHRGTLSFDDPAVADETILPYYAQLDFPEQRSNTDAPDTIQPGLFFDKGFGDLPDSLSWLRPFAITGAFVDEVPQGSRGMALAPDPALGRFDAVFSPAVETLHWGFSIQFSTLYLSSRFNGGPPKDEPLNQFVPLVEFKFDSPRGQYTAVTMNPGFTYVAVTADRGRGDHPAQSRRRQRHRLSGATPLFSGRPNSFVVWEAVAEQSAGKKPDRVVINRCEG